MDEKMVAHAAYDDVDPQIRNISVTDLKDVLAGGLSDFAAHPTHRVFLSLIFPVAGFFMIQMTMNYDVWSLIIPLAAGFALIGPFAAIGMGLFSQRYFLAGSMRPRPSTTQHLLGPLLRTQQHC